MVAGVAVVSGLALLIPPLSRTGEQPGTAPKTLVQTSPDGFARVTAPIPLDFPQAFEAHPDYQTEWWYYVGNLSTSNGQRFGYQLTFFRRGLVPPSKLESRSSDWATNQVYMAHFALTDVGAQRFHAQSRFSRGSAGLAGASSDPLQVWLENWTAGMTGDRNYHLAAAGDGVAVDFSMNDVKGPVLQGDHGFSRKGSGPGSASIYYSATRLETQGTVTSGGQTYNVNGLSWMDREFSTQAMSPNQVGWDWFALQLDDNTDLMFYDMRQVGGTIDPYSSGTVIAPDGRTTSLALSEYSIANLETWTSPHSGAVYPSKWHIEVPSQELTLDIVPLVADQELNVSLTYWEGAVKITGIRHGKRVTGYGYVELTGYKNSMFGQF